MSGGGSFGYNQQSQESQQSASSRVGLRGTKYQDQAADEAYGGGRKLSQLTDYFADLGHPSRMMDYGRQMLPQGRYGLGENADRAVEALGQYQFGRASGDSATRGQLSPENMSAVIGSSMQNMLPFLIPQVQQFQMGQFMAPQSLVNTAKTSADYWLRALGSQSDSQGSSSGSGFGFTSSGGGGVGGGY